MCPPLRLIMRWKRTVTMLSATAYLLAAAGCTSVSPTESITFQPGVCHKLPDSDQWAITVRAGVYSRSFLNSLEPHIVKYMEAHRIIPNDAEAQTFEARTAPFLDDHPKGKVIRVAVTGKVQPLKPSDAAGLVQDRILLNSDEVARLRSESGTSAGWVTFRAVLSKGDRRDFTGRAQILDDQGLTVISDIDDTIKITEVNNTPHMLKNTFLLAFRPVPGMAPLYAKWTAERGAAFHYLSESPLELHDPLVEFLAASGYPPGTMDLREIDWEGSRIRAFLKIVAAPPDFKIKSIQRMIDELPNRRYVLIGDSSQHDPEVYGETARRYRRQVQRILIRDVTCQGPDDPRYQAAFDGLPRTLWQVFRDPSEIADALPRQGM